MRKALSKAEIRFRMWQCHVWGGFRSSVRNPLLDAKTAPWPKLADAQPYNPDSWWATGWNTVHLSFLLFLLVPYLPAAKNFTRLDGGAIEAVRESFHTFDWDLAIR